jgi:hypothetical protein
MDFLSADTLLLYAGIITLAIALKGGKRKHSTYQHKK